MKINKNSLGFILLVIFVGIVGYKNFLWRFDNLIYDAQINFFSTPASDQIVIIGIDEKSLNSFGRWPWRRKVHAALLNKLSGVGSKVIGLDIIFAEPDRIHPNDDEMLAKAIRDNGQVVLPIIFEQVESGLKTTLPLPLFSANAFSLGHANVERGQDGISRKVFLKARHNGPMYPSLALAMYAQEDSEILSAPLKGRNLSAETQTSENNYQGNYIAWLPFYGPLSDFQHYSYIDVLKGVIPTSYFKDKYILIGLTASGMESNITTPITANNIRSTGVNFIASTLDALIKQRIWQPLSKPWQFVLATIIVFLTIQIYKLNSLKKIIPLFLLLLLSILVFSVVLLRLSQYWFAPSASLLAFLMSFPFWTWQRLENIIFALFTEKKRLLITLNSIADGLIITTSDGIIDYLNPVAREMIGLSRNQIIGKHIDNQLTLHAHSHADEGIGALIKYSMWRNKQKHFSQLEFSNHLQKQYIVNMNVNLLYDQNNNVIGSVLTLHDVRKIIEMTNQLIKNTEQQAQLTMKKNQAEQANLAKSQFLSHMSHELRTPLNAIIGFSQLIQLDLSEDPQAKDNLENVDVVIKSAYHLLDLINELLDLASIEANKIELNLYDFDVVSVLEECMKLILPLADERGIKIINQIDQSSKYLVYADQKRVKQVLLNLLSNAVKYNLINGEIKTHTEITENKMVKIYVADTGAGLTTEQQEKLFQSFERLDAGKTKIEGTGFGLFISKQYVEFMGGSIGVQSSVGVGSTFWIELPQQDL